MEHEEYKPTRALLTAFWKKVDKKGECWVWKGTMGNSGYGTLFYKDDVYSAHRLSWMIAHSMQIPRTTEAGHRSAICHTCDNRPCVRPDHLFLGSYFDNMADMRAKGRANYVGGKSLFTDADKEEIKKDWLTGAYSKTELANKWDCSRRTIDRIVDVPRPAQGTLF